MNYSFHRIRILIIGDGFITGSIAPVGEAIVNFVDISCLSIHNTLIAQGRITLLLAHDILTPVPVLPGGHDAVGHLIGRLTEGLGGGCRLIALRHGKALTFRRIIKTAENFIQSRLPVLNASLWTALEGWQTSGTGASGILLSDIFEPGKRK